MKLNNKGWGLAEMLVGVAVILIFLLVAVFFSLRFNSMIEENIMKNEEEIDYKYFYINDINNMIIATDNYLKDDNIELERNAYIKLDLDTLVYLNYINRIYDPISDNECSGYTLSTLDINGIKDINAYISCDNYVSEGYEK